ncbi:glycine cleavage system aminomethyltransferase GcvT [Robbsia sp. Bb-Pol-6]|uniref:Aminomethyltransferase n=1 Tax=Robbsia betulipollinis TaxID=2981849 RepID=A0ABT3ZRF7_9BURK|nr:glycine cleavage system aminomethyltransferase GcvT [Robbsia betulipollinis]MCY0389144.1 glycine cleavage system aminomethyltransferase GcvT [Robbsia betulipollinis]
MTELHKTALNDVHRAAGARMVDFGGWDMPVNYGSQIEEHQGVRSAAGMFDVSHMRAIDLTGVAVRPFLQRLLANDVAKLQTPGRALYSCMLNGAGGVIDDLIVYFFDEQSFRLIVNAGTADKDLAWIGQQNAEGGFDVSIAPRPDLGIIAVQGPLAREKVWEAIPGAQVLSEALRPFHAARLADSPFGPLMIARTGYTGEDGFEIVCEARRSAALWQALRAAGVRPAGLGARDTLRLEAGMNLYGQDMDDAVSPLDAGLAWTVDRSTERAFLGRPALDADGQRAAFVGLLLQGGGGVLRGHQKVLTQAGDGEITSGTFSPSLQRSIAFARVPTGVQPGDTVQVVVRDKQLPATVVKLPFVRNGRTLVAL